MRGARSCFQRLCPWRRSDELKSPVASQHAILARMRGTIVRQFIAKEIDEVAMVREDVGLGVR